MDNLRQNINDIDNQILLLLQNRNMVSQKIGEYKKNNNLPVYDSVRETQLLDRLGKLNMKSDLKLEENFIKEIWSLIMNNSKKLQE
jgi:monofunctional chorismate mutase